VFSSCANFIGIFIKTAVSFCEVFLAMMATSLVTLLLLAEELHATVFLEKLTVPQLVNKLSAFYGA
jgi:hypothetical protein